MRKVETLMGLEVNLLDKGSLFHDTKGREIYIYTYFGDGAWVKISKKELEFQVNQIGYDSFEISSMDKHSIYLTPYHND